MNKKRIVNIVLDVGKTNTKIFLFNTNSKIIKSYFKNFQSKKIGRNQLCPCNSGKKYKHCHGSL